VFKKLIQGIVNLLFIIIVGMAILLAIDDGDDFSPRMPPSMQNDTFQAPSDPNNPQENIEGGETLPGPSPFDDRSLVQAQDAKNWSSGTGFAIAANGVWLTAKHVARGCERLGIINEDGRIAVRAQPIYISEIADVAIFQTQGGPPALALDLVESDIKLGSRALHVGYPQGKPGEVTSRLIGRELMLTEGAWRGKEDTLAWAETARTEGLRGSLGGLSGGPALDMRGNVIGITIAESPRRGRIITTSAASISAALSVASITPRGTPFQPFDQDIATTAQRLRGDLKVVQVICLTDG
jgi:serine protease Do